MKRISILTTLFVLLAGCASTATHPTQRLINPNDKRGRYLYEQWHFSQAVRVGDTVWVSGQVGNGTDIETQTREALKHLKETLALSGATLEDVVELTTLHIKIEDFPRMSKVKDEFFPTNYPAWTAIGVKQLADPDGLIEIRATAVVGSGAKKSNTLQP